MLAHMRKHPIKVKRFVAKRPAKQQNKSNNMIFFVSCPASNAGKIKKLLKEHGCAYVDEKEEWADAKGLFAERTPSNMLIGARGKENVTQVQLSELTGIPRRHISDMENDRRPIGKHNAMKLGKALNVDYRVFL